MTDLAINTEQAGKVQTTDLDASDSIIAITGFQGQVGARGLVQVWCDEDWLYNSDAGGLVNAPIAAERTVTLRVTDPNGVLTFYAKTATTANLYVLTL
jgi:hypothetical protein